MDTNQPFTSLMASAIYLHELKTSFTNAGFTEEQAMQMIIQLLKNNEATK